MPNKPTLVAALRQLARRAYVAACLVAYALAVFYVEGMRK